MYRDRLSRLTVLLVLPSCSGTSPATSVAGEENNVGNRIIRWETAPILKGQVKIYTSTSSEAIPEGSKYAYKLSVNSQEATTTIHSAKEDFPNAVKELIEAEYGNVQIYLKKESDFLQKKLNCYVASYLNKSQIVTSNS